MKQRSVLGFFLLVLISCDRPNDDSKPIDNTLFSDYFNRADTITGLGDSWVVNNPSGTTFTVESKKAYPTTTSAGVLPTAYAKRSITQKHVILSSTFVVDGGTYLGELFLIARSPVSTDFNNGYGCGVRSSDQKLVIRRILDGTTNDLEISPEPIALKSSTLAVLSFELNEFTFNCSISSPVVTTLSTSDTTFFAGYFGMTAGKTSNNYIYFKDFTVTNVPEE